MLETTSIEDCSELCSSLNLDFIELNMNFPQCQLAVLNADTLNHIKKNKQLYFTIHLDENLNVCDFNFAIRDAYLETTLGVIELAREIQAPIINDIDFFQKHIGKLIHMHAHDAKGSSNHLAFGDGEIDLRQRLQLAQKANLRVVLETKTVAALTATVKELKNDKP